MPGRTGVDLSVETVARLAKLETVVGINDATGDPERCRQLREATPGGFRIYSGDDATTCRSIRAGADGAISVIENAFPRRWRVMCLAALAGRAEEARDLADGMSGIVAAMGLESNPCPIKYLMALTCPGHSTEVRLPLVPVSAETASAIRQAHDAHLRGACRIRGKDSGRLKRVPHRSRGKLALQPAGPLEPVVKHSAKDCGDPSTTK